MLNRSNVIAKKVPDTMQTSYPLYSLGKRPVTAICSILNKFIFHHLKLIREFLNYIQICNTNLC